MNEINPFLDGAILQIPIPMAPPLRYVNSYLLRGSGEDGYTLIDPGPRTAETEREWAGIWAELQLRPGDIRQIVLTHHHPDHFGLAGYMQELTGAEVLMSRQSFREAERMWDQSRSMNAALPAWFAQHGLPRTIADRLPAHLEGFFAQVSPAPKVTYIRDGETLAMGGLHWEPIETGGHASGHLAFYNVERRIMICGDAVLPQISPNISMVPGGDPQPLQTFLAGLRKLEAYDVQLAFPGHRHVFEHFRERISALQLHHEERLEKICRLLADGPQNAYEVCLALFGDKLDIHQLRFALSESLAHLAELVRRERAAVETGEGGGAALPPASPLPHPLSFRQPGAAAANGEAGWRSGAGPYRFALAQLASRP